MCDIKLCKNCKHYRNRLLSSINCIHPKNIKIDLVRGKDEVQFSNNYLRTYDYKCGKKGKWFESRK